MALILVVTSPIVVKADSIRLSGSFHAFNFFTLTGSDTAPFDSIKGTFQLIYDDALVGIQSPTLDSLDLAIGATMFNSNNASVEIQLEKERGLTFGFLEIGGDNLGVNLISSFTNDFNLLLSSPFIDSPLAQFRYTVDNASSAFIAFNLGPEASLDLSIKSVPVAAVPEPSALLLFTSGIVSLISWRWWNTTKKV